MVSKKWQILSPQKPKSQKEIIDILLANRGIRTPKQKEEFFNPSLTSLSDIILPQLEKAKERIFKAIRDDEKIIVYGDYDVDGICGTAILWETFHELGAKVLPYIPHRKNEGYGLSRPAITKMATERVSLIITCDHGITACDEVDLAQKLGIDVIICDHHLPTAQLPRAFAIIHSLELSGVGVAYLLAQALKPQPQRHLDLVALGTVADMLSLVGKNRALVKFGLKNLRQTQRIGLLKLLEKAGVSQKDLATYHLSFILAPRLNAMGRLEHALDSLRLLCTKNPEKAESLAQVLHETNQRRQELTGETLLSAKEQVLKKQKNKIYLLGSEDWSPGILGLVAGKIVEEFFRPTILLSLGDKISRASARSVSGFNIVEALRKHAQDLLLDVGGHPQACGFSLKTENIPLLEERLLQIAEKELTDEQLTPSLKIETEVDLGYLDFNLAYDLARFEPFGLGNQEPIFAGFGLQVKDARVVGGGGEHLKLWVGDKTSSFSAIGFGLGEKLKELGSFIDVAFNLEENEWNGEKRLELKVKDIK